MKWSLLIAILISFNTYNAHAANETETALDAVSKFSESGSSSCNDSHDGLKIISSKSILAGPHILKIFEIKTRNSETYQIKLIDGKAIEITLTGTQGS